MPSFSDEAVHVRVPATSANLGPGFDAAGLALSLYDDVEVRVVADGLSVTVDGEGSAHLPRNERHFLVKSLRVAFDRLGGQPSGLEVRCRNRIPHSRGLGSSSAVICAALLAARALVVDGQQQLDDDALLVLADQIEGHPDNVAACLRGGLTLAWGSPVRVLRLDTHPDLVAVAFVPPTRSSTRATRGLLPETVPFADAAANAGRAALLAHALTVDPALLLDATQDWLHQPYRAAAMPASAALVQALRGDGIAAVVSGAGPTVLALAPAASAAGLSAACPVGWSALNLTVDGQGGRVLAPASG